jgi:hypothetical protein
MAERVPELLKGGAGGGAGAGAEPAWRVAGAKALDLEVTKEAEVEPWRASRRRRRPS